MFSVKKKHNKVGLSLRGGAAGAIGYVGLLRAFEENGIPIDYIIGSSAGAVVGASYAAGKTLDEIREHFRGLIPRKFVDLNSLKEKSFFSYESMRDYTKKLLGDMKLEDCKIPIIIQTTSLTTYNVAFHEKGFLYDLIPASAAFPMLIPPVEIDNELHIDGDLSSGYGADFLRKRGVDIVIGASTGRLDFDSENEVLSRFMQPLFLTMKQLRRLDLALNPVDLLISHLGEGIKPLDFSNAPEFEEVGYNRTLESIKMIKKLL